MKDLKLRTSNMFGALFGLIFLVVGLAVGYMTIGNMTIKYFSSKNWQPVAVEISELELKSYSGETTTYKVLAHYSYRINGRRYQSDQVALSNRSDNIGDYWQTLYSKLQNDKRNQATIAWVNPKNPEQSMLDRTFRWPSVWFGCLFIVMFGGFGVGIIWLSLKASKSKEEVINLAKANGINSNEKTSHWFMLCFGGVFFLIGSFFAFMIIPDILRTGEYAGLLVLVFVVVGALIIFFALRSKHRYKIIGPSPIYLDPLPGEVGGQVGGSFDVGYMPWREPLQMTLSCLRKTKSGKNTNTSIVWQESVQAHSQQQSNGLLVRFLIDCPTELPASKEWKNRSSVEWELKTEGLLMINSKPFEFLRTWKIPMIKTEVPTLSSINLPQQFLQQLAGNKSALAEQSADAQIQIKQQQGFIKVSSLKKRPIMSSFLGILFGVIFAGAGVFTFEEWWPGYVFILIGVLVCFSSFFLVGREIELKINAQTRLLFMRRSWFGLRLYKREVILYEPSQFSIKKTSSTTSGTKLTEFYSVQIDNNDKKVLVAEAIEGKGAAQAVLDNIVQQAFPGRD